MKNSENFLDLGSLGTLIFDSLPTTRISASSHPRRSPTTAALENDGARPLLEAERSTAVWIHPNYRCTNHVTRFQPVPGVLAGATIENTSAT